jgi:hypothetical protein
MLVYQQDDKCYIGESIQPLWTAQLIAGFASLNGWVSESDKTASNIVCAPADYTDPYPKPTNPECTKAEYEAMGFKCTLIQTNDTCVTRIGEFFNTLENPQEKAGCNPSDSELACAEQVCGSTFTCANSTIYGGATWCIGIDDDVQAKARASSKGYTAAMERVIQCSVGRGMGYVPEVTRYTANWYNWNNPDKVPSAPDSDGPPKGSLEGEWVGAIFKERTFEYTASAKFEV